MLDIPYLTFRRMAAVVDARRCWVIACVCLLIVAAALRFYNLSGHTLKSTDEVLAAIYSKGDISEVLENTRYDNTSPILYPLALWAVQKAASTEFSVRVLPAAASALTVGALLFLMPRVGVPRRAAFLAALLCALSVTAIEHGRGGREYSVDMLAAALMIAGLLQYMRDGRKGLLCAALLAGPLLQYGLVLFGAAALGVAAVVGGGSSETAACDARRRSVWTVLEWLRRRVDLVLPIACFGAACAISWAVTGRYQWKEGGHGGASYLESYYYQNGFEAAAFAEFAVSRTWEMIGYHMPPLIAGLALLAFGWLLLSALTRRRLDAVALLALFAVGVAVCAALPEAYPYGGIRQNLYLGPIVFLAAGSGFHLVAVDAAALARRGWVAPALAAAAGGAIAIAGAGAVQRASDNLYRTDQSLKQVIAALDELEREGDVVYAAKFEALTLEFYKPEKPDNYFYGFVFHHRFDPFRADYVTELLDEMFRAFDSPRRIWMIYNRSVSVTEALAAYSEGVSVEEVATDGWFTLHLITDFEEAAANVRKKWLDAVSGVPDAVSGYNLHLQEDALYYAKQPCVPADTEGRFFLSISPEDTGDLPSIRRHYKSNYFLDFQVHGLRVGDKCIMRRDLPDYPIERIHTGQIADSGERPIWESGVSLNPKKLFSAYEEVVSVPPSAASDYDVHLREDALYYAKRPCAPSDAEAPFFLHIYPEDAGDLPRALRRQGYQNLDFGFYAHGLLSDDRCLIRIDLPDYPIERVHTGQFALDGSAIWEVDFAFNPKQWFGMYDDIVSESASAAAAYNLYLREDALYYAKRPCGAADVAAPFFLHIYPEDAGDLPRGLRQYGFHNLDFEFQVHGLRVGDRCLIRRDLPEYRIERIHTGQFVLDGPTTWEAELSFSR